MGVMVSSSHVVSAAPSSSAGGLITLCPCSSVRFLSRDSVLHKFLQRESFPWAADLHELPQHGSFSRGAILQEQAAPAWVPHGVTSPASKPAAAWGPFHGLQVDICSTVYLHGLQGDKLPHHGLHHELQGKTLCSRISSTSSPSFFTDLGVCRVVSFTSSHSSLLTAISPQFFLPLLKYVITEELSPSLMGLALASGGSVLEPPGTGFIRHGEIFWQLLTEAIPVAPFPATKILPCKPITTS